ncbi:MAG: TRAP transporter permease [Rhodothermales bacterium]
MENTLDKTYSYRTIAVTLLSICFVGYHVWAVVKGTPPPLAFRSTHLLFVLLLVFLIFPSGMNENKPQSSWGKFTDFSLIAISFFSIGYIFVNYDEIIRRFAYVTPIEPMEWVAGIACVCVVLEATRRTIGLSLPITAALFIVYVALFSNVTPDLILDQLYLTTEGVFGIALGVSASYMVMFILFGAFVERMGTGHLFMDGAVAVAGSASGGPAKVAVLTSALFGSISGSPTANVMTTGAFTIPLMKKLGYRPAFAGAVEAVASTGGQILPPIMGAAAFVMVEFMGRSYVEVMGMAIIPALLFFVAVFSAVHFEAKRQGIKGLSKSDLPILADVLTKRGHQVLPLVVIVTLLLSGYSAPYSAFWSALSIIPVALLRKGTRYEVSISNFLEGILATARNTLIVAVACASAGIVVGVITLSGLTLTFTELVVQTSGDSLILALMLCSLAGIIIAMGLPTTPAYILQTALLVPALIKLGVVVQAAHFFVLYFAVLSVITPPVAISLFAASSLSGAGVWPTGLASLRLSASGYIIPFMFVYHPELLMIGDPTDIGIAAISALVGVTVLSAGLNQYFLTRSRIWESAILTISAISLMLPDLTTDLAGLGLIAVIAVLQFARSHRSQS